jgi:hypothetical protein
MALHPVDHEKEKKERRTYNNQDKLPLLSSPLLFSEKVPNSWNVRS